MLKEIHEQPAVMRRIIQEYQDEEGNLKIDKDIIKDVADADRIYIIAAGTSYHAGLVGKSSSKMGRSTNRSTCCFRICLQYAFII